MILMAAVCLAMSTGESIAAETAASTHMPNLVFIMADDLGWADVGFHGGNAPTPNLDRLAAENLELLAHYVAPVCSPTRTGLMTGRQWSRYGVVNPQNNRALPFDTVTLPRALKEQGYATCLTGKWHLGSLPDWGPNHFGFDHGYGSLAGGVTPWLHRYKKGPYTETWHRDEVLIEEQGHVTDLITHEALTWLEGHATERFFLYVPYTAVHLPIKEPSEWVERVPASITGDVPRHYAASVMHLDDCVGQLVSALDRLKVREQTLLVFTSDNGGSTAENNDLQYPDDMCPNGRLPGNNLPWRGQKGDLYEGGVRVPAIVSWPGHVPAGKTDEPVQIIDWMPTLCSLAGYSATESLNWDGVDISGLLLRHESLPERPLYSVGLGGKLRSLRRGDWKLIVRGEGELRRVELFNLRNDPGEQSNLFEKEVPRLMAMLRELEEFSSHDREDEVPKE